MVKNKKKIDLNLLLIIFGILLLGFLMLFSVSAQKSLEAVGNTYYFLAHQFIYGIIPGLSLGFIAFKIDLVRFKKIGFFFFLLNLILLLTVFLPGLGITKGGGRRWLGVGPFSFQPSEFLKITLPLYLAVWLAGRKKKDLKTFCGFFLICLPVITILLLQPDLGTLVLIMFSACLIYFLSETPIWHGILILAVAFAALLLLVVFKSYRMQRLLIFLNPEIDPMGIGYQLKQSLIAIGSGGFWGKGLGFSQQKFGLLPNVISDSIFAAFCEETGLIGPFILIVLFLLFLVRIIFIVQKTREDFSRSLGLTLGASIVIQAFFNMGAMMSVIPLTGIPLPFISYGGTHLMVELIMVGILLNISQSS